MLKRLRALLARTPKQTPIEQHMTEREEVIELDEILRRLKIKQPKETA